MIIFLAGIHGVGKTHLGRPVAERLRIRFAIASQLIREERGRSTWSSDRFAAEIDDNQLALIKAIQRLSQSRGVVLLDGHFVLKNTRGEIVPLSIEVFRQLELSGAVLMKNAPGVIAERLLKRSGANYDLQEIADLQTAEEGHATVVCSTLGISLCCLSMPTEESLFKSLTSIIGNASGPV